MKNEYEKAELLTNSSNITGKCNWQSEQIQNCALRE